MIIYTDKVEGGERVKMLPVILINPEFKDGKGLIAHEKEHVKQYFMFFPLGFLLYPFMDWWCLLACIMVGDLLYTFVPYIRLRCEARAYKVQLRYGGRVDA